jgi:hypothetical protein
MLEACDKSLKNNGKMVNLEIFNGLQIST